MMALKITNSGGQQSSQDKFIVTQERSVTSGSGSTLTFDVALAVSSFTPSSSNPVNVYLIFLNDHNRRRY